MKRHERRVSKWKSFSTGLLDILLSISIENYSKNFPQYLKVLSFKCNILFRGCESACFLSKSLDRLTGMLENAKTHENIRINTSFLKFSLPEQSNKLPNKLLLGF